MKLNLDDFGLDRQCVVGQIGLSLSSTDPRESTSTTEAVALFFRSFILFGSCWVLLGEYTCLSTVISSYHCTHTHTTCLKYCHLENPPSKSITSRILERL
nr:hypothetical protein CFP56_32676 [Quercus suber]